MKHYTQPVILLWLLYSFGILVHDPSPVVQLVKQALNLLLIYIERDQPHIWKIKRRKMLIIKINSHLRFLKKFRVTEWVVFEMSVFFYWFKHFILSHFTNHLVTFLHKQFLILIRCFRFDIYLKSLTIALPSQFIISYFLDSKKPL